MTNEQRHDLEVEWQVTSTRLKELITTEYRNLYGDKFNQEHWERYLVKALNLKQVWQTGGLL